MAIQPIDLQTLYTQLDKVGKTQVQQQVAAQSIREAEMQANKTSAEDRLKTVQTPEAGEEGAGAVHEKQEPADSGSRQSHQREKRDEENQSPPEKEVIRDPGLGAHVDITG